MSDTEDWVVIILGVFVLLFMLSGIATCSYKYAITDTDCWLADDPIICQKIKDSVKQLYYNGGIYAKHLNLFTCH